MQAYVEGDAEAFERLFESLAPSLRAFFTRSVRDASVTEDLMLTTFLKLHGARRRWRRGERLRPWVFGISGHVRVDWRRAASPGDALDEEEVPASPSSADPSDGLDHRERSERVHAALESLPESQRVVVHLHRFDGLGFAERLEPRPSGSVILNVEAHWRAGIEAEVVVAAVEDRATTKVTRGENAGRTLTHVAIVRSMSVVGTGAGTFSGPTVIDPVEWRRANRVVAYVQERRGGPVHAVDSVTLPVMVAPTRLKTSR